MWSYTFQLKHKVDPDLDHWHMFGVCVCECVTVLQRAFSGKNTNLVWTSSSPGDRLALIWQNLKKVHPTPRLELRYELRLR